MSMYRSDRRPPRNSTARRATVSAAHTRGPEATSESVNRRLGTGSIGVQRAEGDGPNGPRNAEFHRGRDAESYDRLGFDRHGINDAGVAASSLGIRY